MKAIRIHKHGAEDVLVVDEVDKPKPKGTEVLVKIKATSLNHMDIWVRKGMPGIGKLPLILGCDGSGVVEACGEAAKDLCVGDSVFVFPLTSCGECRFCQQGKINQCVKFNIFGEHRDGTHCEYFCVDKKNLIKFDAKILSFEEAASFPLVFLTAWNMLHKKAQMTPEDTVLVIGSSSGVGSAAIQIAKLHGCKVIATAGTPEKLIQAFEWGADHVIDHYRDSISAKVREFTDRKGADVIFEHVGEKVWAECLKSLAWSGRLVTCGATSGPNVSMDLRHIFIKQQKIIGSTMGTREDVENVYKFMAQKKLKPCVGKIFPFQKVAEAHRYLESSGGFGKVVLKWA